MADPRSPITELFDLCREIFPASMKPDTWYLVVASALVTASDPSQIGHLYTYLTGLPSCSASEQRQVVNRRVREFLLKQWVTVGVPKVAVGLFSLIEAEQPGDADLSLTKKIVAQRDTSPLSGSDLISRRKYTVLDAPNRQRGTDFLIAVYGPERAANMFMGWGADMEWLTKDVVYGLFYADDGVLDMLETELITYTAIACQGLHVPLANHLGGLRRMGLSAAEAEGVTTCAKTVVQWVGKDTSGWRPVGEVIAWD